MKGATVTIRLTSAQARELAAMARYVLDAPCLEYLETAGPAKERVARNAVAAVERACAYAERAREQQQRRTK